MKDEYDFEDLELANDLKELAKIDRVTKKRLTVPDRRKLRNLRQYKSMTDEEFDELFAQKELGIVANKEFEERTINKINKFGVDYDLEDLNSNDMLVLRSLAQNMISLEDLELETYNIRKDGIDLDNIVILEKMERMKNEKVGTISKLQDDLKITRRVRKSDKDQGAQEYLEDLKRKAKDFYESKMQLIFCPKCHTWIGSVWYLFPKDDRSYVTFYCDTELGDGTKCGERIKITISDLVKNGGSNKKDIPQSLI